MLLPGLGPHGTPLKLDKCNELSRIRLDTIQEGTYGLRGAATNVAQEEFYEDRFILGSSGLDARCC
jgi:hypothetical protein